MPAKRARGLTLAEVLVVAVIAAVLASLIFVLAKPALQRTNVSVCSMRMKQIYQAGILYANDYESPTYEEIEPFTYIEYPGDYIDHYVKDWRVMQCPSAAPYAGASHVNTYVPAFFGEADASEGNHDLDDPNFKPEGKRKANIDLMKAAGDDFPIVSCTIHDELDYQPSEGPIGTPWLTWIRRDGSLKSGRAPWSRREQFLKFLKMIAANQK